MDLFKKKNGETNSGGNGGRRKEPHLRGEGASGGGEQTQQQKQTAPAGKYLFIPIMSTSTIRRLDPKKTVLLVCDIQAKFSEFLFCRRGVAGLFDDNDATGDVIYGFEEVVATTAKMFKIAKVSVDCHGYRIR